MSDEHIPQRCSACWKDASHFPSISPSSVLCSCLYSPVLLRNLLSTTSSWMSQADSLVLFSKGFSSVGGFTHSLGNDSLIGATSAARSSRTCSFTMAIASTAWYVGPSGVGVGAIVGVGVGENVGAGSELHATPRSVNRTTKASSASRFLIRDAYARSPKRHSGVKSREPLVNGKRPWRGNLKERYEQLVNTSVNTPEGFSQLHGSSLVNSKDLPLSRPLPSRSGAEEGTRTLTPLSWQRILSHRTRT